MAAKKAAVTGSAGFVATHLCAALAATGYEVVGVDKKTGIDIGDTDALRKAFAGAEYVFHCAADTSVPYSIEHPGETHETNVNGTLSVLIAARDAGVRRVVFSSSAAVYGEQKNLPLREAVPLSPKSPYGLHKYIGELYCKLFSELYGLETVSLRYFNIYGPGAPVEGSYASVTARFINLRKEGKELTITGDGTQTRDLVHVRDVVAANICAAQSAAVGKGEAFNIGSGKSISILELAEQVGGPTTFLPARNEIQHSLADISGTKELLGWTPQVSLAEGVQELKKLHNLN